MRRREPPEPLPCCSVGLGAQEVPGYSVGQSSYSIRIGIAVARQCRSAALTRIAGLQSLDSTLAAAVVPKSLRRWM